MPTPTLTTPPLHCTGVPTSVLTSVTEARQEQLKRIILRLYGGTFCDKNNTTRGN